MNAGSLGRRVGTLPERHGGAWVLAVLCLIVAVGVGIRVYYALEREDGVQDDSIRYYFIAQSLYEDQSFDAPEVERDEAYHPGSPLFHAGVFYLTGGVNPKASRVAAALLSALMIVFTYLVARRLAWEAPRDRAPPAAATAAGLIAAGLIAVYPSSIDFYRSLMNEPLASITLIGAVLATLWAADRASPWAWAVPGAAIGLTVMFRPEALLFGLAFAVIAIVHVWRARDRDSGLLAGAAVFLAMAAVLMPWTIRNAITLEKPVPVTEGGGNALFIGTYLPGDGDHFKTYDKRTELLEDYGVPPSALNDLPPGYILGDVLELIALNEHPELSQDAVLRKLGREQLKEDVTEHPVEYAGVLAQKFWNMWGQGAAAKQRQGGPGAFGDWYHRLVVLLAIAGLVLLGARGRWEAWVLGSVLVLATLVAVLLLAPPRRNVDLLPLVAVLAGYAVATGWPGFHVVRGRITESTTLSR